MKKRKLTIKQRRLIKNYTDPESPSFGNKTKSGLRAGYKNERTGRSELLKPKLKEEIEMILERKNFGTNQILDKIIEVAKVSESAKDRTNVLQACRMLLELSDRFPSKKEEVKVEEVGNISSKDIQELKEIMDKSLKQGEN